jgi:hypothetical protein
MRYFLWYMDKNWGIESLIKFHISILNSLSIIYKEGMKT